MLPDESTDEGENSRMSVFVRFVDALAHKPVERFVAWTGQVLSGKRKDPQCRIHHTSPQSIYIICNNHRLALSKAHDTKVSHTHRIRSNASVN